MKLWCFYGIWNAEAFRPKCVFVFVSIYWDLSDDCQLYWSFRFCYRWCVWVILIFGMRRVRAREHCLAIICAYTRYVSAGELLLISFRFFLRLIHCRGAMRVGATDLKYYKLSVWKERVHIENEIFVACVRHTPKLFREHWSKLYQSTKQHLALQTKRQVDFGCLFHFCRHYKAYPDKLHKNW